MITNSKTQMMKSVKHVAAVAVVATFGLASCDSTEDLGLSSFGDMEQEAFLESVEMALEGEIESVSFAGRIGGEANLSARGGKGFRGFSDCATVTKSGEEFPKTITIDFGEGCEGPHGHTKSGQIVVTISDAMSNVGATRTVTFENFSINDKAVVGTRVTTNQGQNADGFWVVTKSVNMTLTDSEGATLSKTFDGSKTWLSGFGADSAATKGYQKDGSGSITGVEGNTFTKTITTPIMIDHSCRYPLSGVVEMSGPEGEGTLDFGDGACDNLATVTRDGETEEIDLDSIKRRKRRRLRD
ncbi:MAG TPA: hypothetical protein DCE41_02835 [Cytophagales bacterium]|nr:hypothetical protein [Cytophagales bacterium]